MNQTLLKKQTKADSFLDFRWLCHWYQGFPCLFIECCFHAYVWCAFSLRRLRLTQGRQDTPSPKYENNIPWTATEIPDINTLHSLSHNLCLRYLDFQKLYNICTIGAHVGHFDLSPPLRPEKGVGGTRALAHSIIKRHGLALLMWQDVAVARWVSVKSLRCRPWSGWEFWPASKWLQRTVSTFAKFGATSDCEVHVKNMTTSGWKGCSSILL